MMFVNDEPQRWSEHSIFRIISEDREPRDEKGSRLKVLKFILENEDEFPSTTKGWVINSFVDRDFRQEVIDILASHNQYMVVIPWARIKYNEAKTRDEKIVAAIGINRARNLAVEHGRMISKFITVLDGDCFFTSSQWNHLTKKIQQDQQYRPDIKHYSVPCSRSTIEHATTSDEAMMLAEPMPIFRHDSTLRFDENIPFGKGDKLNFLYKLNHSTKPGHHHEMINEDVCKCFGLVHHLAGSAYEIEQDVKLRVGLRNESLDALIYQLDNYVCPTRMPNDYWKTIQGYFDFQGLYSHFAFDHPNGSKFVEVGSWQGASACYLATEIKNRNKDIQLFAVDTWMGSDEDVHRKHISAMGGTEVLFQNFKDHMDKAGVSHIVTPVRTNSVEASKQFADESLDVVFIDASHDYYDVLSDIQHWYPKVKKGGKLAGHDFVPCHPISEKGVIRAVLEFFVGKNLELSPAGRTWLHHK